MSWTLTWTIPEQQLSAIKDFYMQHADRPMVQRRRQKNVVCEGRDFSRDAFIKVMLSCLCTSRQLSGPNDRVAQFFRRHPFPITEQYCNINQPFLAERLKSELSGAGIRFTNKIPAHFAENLRRLENSNWQLLQELRDHIPNDAADEEWERRMARSISMKKNPYGFKLKGFGPKQSRNLLQIMGVSRFEVPLDSRFTNWLHQQGFLYQLTDNELQSSALYEIVVDAVKELSQQIGVYPCLLDAAVFSSVDGDGWTIENLVF